MLAVKGIPVVGPVIDAAKELSQGLIDRENRERQRRLQDYVLGVVRDEQYNDTVEFREEDVIPVIRKLAADDETAKTDKMAQHKSPWLPFPDVWQQNWSH
ncbi:hypothetical protein OK94_07440 [Salmonella enterica]|nr:hypothetical protein [Salmonella enterica]EDR3139010.1 hypothetical protein [Salmonella enterica subsp. enterica serovar Horsham]EAY0393837.1 hypothetical protein [Salmonella enterica]EBA2077137.1 hypothetical protein [Salmonella enterica]EBP1887554.1 hypothetical protein [Salmonella enterica]